MNKRAAIYARVSTDDQRNNYSLPTQIEHGRLYAEQQKYDVVAEFQEDFTGTLLDRPELDRLRELARRHEIDVLIVLDIDRLARDMLYQLMLEKEFERYGVNVEYELTPYDGSPGGQLLKQMKGVISQYERAVLFERMARGKQGRAKAGYVLPAGTLPYGYDYVRDPDGHKGYYVINEEEAGVVRLMYHWLVYGDDTGKRLSTAKIARQLSEMGIPTRRDKKPGSVKLKGRNVWAHNTVNGILRSELYIGKAFYNRYKVKNGKKSVNDRSQWIEVPVPPIVDRELWELAQKQIVQNMQFAPRNTQHAYLLRGLITCSRCGMTFNCKGANRKHGRVAYYFCGGTLINNSVDHKTKPCSGVYRIEMLDALVWDTVKGALKHPETIIEVMRDIQTTENVKADLLNGRLETLTGQQLKLLTKRENLVALYLDSVIPKSDLDKQASDIAAQLERLKTETEAVNTQLAKETISDEKIESMVDFCTRIQDGLDLFTYEDKRLTLERLNISCTMQRGATRAQDVLIIFGYMPVTSETIAVRTSLPHAPEPHSRHPGR